MAYLGIDELKTQPEQKYYWLVYVEVNELIGGHSYSEKVVEIHPFELMKGFYTPRFYTLLNWREITKEEYDLFNA